MKITIHVLNTKIWNLWCGRPRSRLFFRINSLKSIELFVNFEQFKIIGNYNNPCLYFGCILLLFCFVKFRYFKWTVEEMFCYGDLGLQRDAHGSSCFLGKWDHPNDCIAGHEVCRESLSKCNSVYVHVDRVLLHLLQVKWGLSQQFLYRVSYSYLF